MALKHCQPGDHGQIPVRGLKKTPGAILLDTGRGFKLLNSNDKIYQEFMNH